MARERRDGGERSLLITLLAIFGLIAVSVVVLVLTQGDAPKQPRADTLVGSTTSAPSSGPVHDELLVRCRSLQATLAPITDFTVTGLAAVPAGAPKPVGSEQVSCALTAKGRRFVGSSFLGTTGAGT